MKPHVHAELIKAWADGAEIEFLSDESNQIWIYTPQPSWSNNLQFRIKPEEKKPVVRWKWAFIPSGETTWFESSRFFDSKESLIASFERIAVSRIPTQIVRLDYTRAEFPE